MPAILPPFGDLLAFDAAARHGSFTRAARDLNVSQPAISRRVAALEADLGVLLFSRESKPLRLTVEGQGLFDVLRSGLSRLEATVIAIRRQRSERRLTIAAAPGFLSYWLVPRLSELAATFPDYDLRLVTGDQAGAMPEADVHVRFGDGKWPGVEAIRILDEQVYAVCSPFFLEGQERPLALNQLAKSRLLQLSATPEQRYDWQSWFHALGVDAPRKLNAIDFDDYSLLVSAALAGQGIALCWSGLLDAFLQTGALVRVSKEEVHSQRGYFATFVDGTLSRSAVVRLAKWLGDQGNASGAAHSQDTP